MTNETAPDLNFRCCGCGKIWTESHFPCDCPTDVLYQRDGKNSRLKSVWIKAKEVTALEAAQARIAELEADCSRLNEGIEAIRQFGSDTLSGPTDSSHDTRDWQRAAVKVMTWRAQLLLNGYDWDAGGEGDTPSARQPR